MDTKVSSLFYSKKAQTISNKLLSTYLRVTASDAKPACVAAYIAQGKWSVKASRVK